MRWTILVLMISLSATLAAPKAKSKKAKPAGPPCPVECARQKVSEIEAAEEFYRRGNAAEAMSNAAFTCWVKTLRVPNFDVATNRWVFAVDQYANATRYNPAHWRAQRRLGLLLANAPGTHAYDVLAVMHLVAYMSLAPEEPQVPRAKQLIDQRLGSLIARRELEKIRGEADLDPVRATEIIADRAKAEYLAVARRMTDYAKQQSELEAFARGVPSVFAEQVLYNHDMAKRVLERNAASAAAAGGMGGGPGGPGGMPGGAPGGPGGMPGGAPGGPGVVGGGGGAGGGTAALTATATVPETFRDLARTCNYVPEFLAMIGAMHRFMDYLDYYKIAYDPRPPQMLIGESVVQLRRLFTRNRIAGPTAMRGEYNAIADKGSVHTLHFWTNRDFRRPLPEYLLNPGQMPKNDLIEKQYNASMQTQVVRPPGYRKAEDETEHMARNIAQINLSTVGSQESWLLWRNVLLKRNPLFVGGNVADDDFLARYVGVGTGQLSTWVPGPLPKRETKTAAGTEDRRWLVSEAH